MPGPVSDSFDPGVLTCAYCGAEYESSIRSSRDDALYEHIQQCEHHPLRHALAKCEALTEECESLLRVVDVAEAALHCHGLWIFGNRLIRAIEAHRTKYPHVDPKGGDHD